MDDRGGIMENYKVKFYPNCNGEERMSKVKADEVIYQSGEDVIFKENGKVVAIVHKAAYEIITKDSDNDELITKEE